MDDLKRDMKWFAAFYVHTKLIFNAFELTPEPIFPKQASDNATQR